MKNVRNVALAAFLTIITSGPKLFLLVHRLVPTRELLKKFLAAKKVQPLPYDNYKDLVE